MKLIIYFEISTASFSTRPMPDIMNDRYLHPQNEIIIFLFRNYYRIIPAPGPMTDIMNDRYLYPQNEIIFFYFETITASFQHLDQ